MDQIIVMASGAVMFITSIIIVVAGFKKSVGTGFLCLCIPFYIYFFAFARYESPKKKIVIGLWLAAHVLYIIGIILSVKALMGAMQ